MESQMSKSLITLTALAALYVASAQAGPHVAHHRNDEVKPPVFAFAPKSTTETQALTAAAPRPRVWTDDYRPAPASFYQAPAQFSNWANDMQALPALLAEVPVWNDDFRPPPKGFGVRPPKRLPHIAGSEN
jgi:hypothetical protein